MAITFGYGKTYDWSSTYWSTKTNIQTSSINTTAVDGHDGWVILAFITETDVNEWDNTTGWTATVPGSYEINPAGQLHVTYSTSLSYIYKIGWVTTNTSSTQFLAIKVDSWADGTSYTTPGGVFGYHQFSTLMTNFFWKKDASNYLHLTYNSGGAWDPAGDQYTTTLTVDNRWHIMGDYNPNATNGSIFVVDGVEVATGLKTPSSGGNHDGAIGIAKDASDSVTPEYHCNWLRHWNSATPYVTTDGVLESDATASVFNAGAGKQWKKLDWTALTSNSTTLTVQVRCASSSGGLSSATYETVTSGNDFSTKGQYAQIKATFADASSGRYTPVLKDMTLTDEAASSAGGGSIQINTVGLLGQFITLH